MNRDVWTINNKNFKLFLDACVDNDIVSDKKFSIGSDLWTNEIPCLAFSDSETQKQYDHYVSDLINLFTEPTVDEIFINAKIGEESEYYREGLFESIFIRKIEEYVVDEIIE